MSKEDIIQILDEIGRRIEGPAEQLFELAVRRVVSGAIIGLILCAVLVVVFAATSWYSMGRSNRLLDEQEARYQKRLAEWQAAAGKSQFLAPVQRDYVQDGEGWLAAAISFAIAAVVSFCFMIPNVLRLINAEWYALRELLRAGGLG